MIVIYDSTRYTIALGTCAAIGKPALSEGIAVHNQIQAKNVHIDAPLWNAIIKMYGNCGHWNKARETWQQMLKSG